MGKLIDADALIHGLRVDPAECPGCPEPEFLDDIISLLEEAPPVDAVPVRHGRWVMMEGELAFWDECSECGKKILHRTPYYDFCPNCGANMRKDGNA